MSATNFEPLLLRRIIEAALLASMSPLSLSQLVNLFPEEGLRPSDAEIQQALRELAESLADGGMELKQVASGYRLQVPEELAPWISRLWEERPPRYSRALLETLALIAYRQPITRAEIEEVRGVSVSSHIVRTLLEREWVRVLGHKEVPGRPALYGTTKQFLDYFNLRSLDEMPTLKELQDLERVQSELEFDSAAQLSLEEASSVSTENPPADLSS